MEKSTCWWPRTVWLIKRVSRNTVEKISIRYIVNARFPTERAHGYQIAQNVSAFMENGISTELWHPYRENTQELRGKL